MNLSEEDWEAIHASHAEDQRRRQRTPDPNLLVELLAIPDDATDDTEWLILHARLEKFLFATGERGLKNLLGTVTMLRDRLLDIGNEVLSKQVHEPRAGCLSAGATQRPCGLPVSAMGIPPVGSPHYLRDSMLRSNGMREAAEIARNLRPKSACTCGGYISFHNGIPGHQPGCLVGECLEIADEIDARADEIDETPDRWLAELDAAETKKP